MKQITIGRKTWCKTDWGWIGPNYEAPSLFLLIYLELHK